VKRRQLIAAGASLPVVPVAPGAAQAQRTKAASERVLRIALRTPEVAFDPVQTQSDFNSATILQHILEAPLGYDYLARPVRMVPVTAAAMPEVSADGRTFTVRIRPGIFFADDPAFKGAPRELVAEDYVYTVKRFYDPKWNSSDLYLYEPLKLLGMAALRERALKDRKPFDYDTPAEGLRALDRYTFRVVLGESDPRFLFRFADPCYMGAVAREVVEHYRDDIGAHPVGTGAFRLKSWRRSSRIELERSPSWRGERYAGTPADEPAAREAAEHLRGKTLPLVDRIEISVIEESQPRWLSFVNGTLSFLEVTGPFREIAAPGGRLAPFLARRGVKLHSQLQPDMTMDFFFMDDPIVGGYTPDKVALRRAISLAFDSRRYIRLLLGGFGIPAQSTLAPFTSGYDPAYKSEMSEYSPSKAKALLDLYGYVDRDGDGFRELPDGRPLVLRMAGTPNQQTRKQHELWKRALDAVGLKIEFEIQSWPELLKKSRAGSLMMWGYSWAAGSPDGGFFLSIAYGPNASEANDPRFSLPAFDRLFERQRALPDGPEREALMRQAKNMLVAYMPFKVHVHNVLLDVVQPGTKGYWRHPFMRDIWRYIDVEPSHPDA
jgi:ABC-type transport system substrate-binding protein